MAVEARQGTASARVAASLARAILSESRQGSGWTAKPNSRADSK